MRHHSSGLRSQRTGRERVVSKTVLRSLTSGAAAMGIARIKDRPRSEFWLLRFGTRHADPQPPHVDQTWDDVRALVAHCLTTEDVHAVLSHLAAVRIERQAQPPAERPLVVFIATVPVVGGWKTRLEIELDATKAAVWQLAVDDVTRPQTGLQLQLI